MGVAVAVGSGRGVGGIAVLVGMLVGVEIGVGLGVEQEASRAMSKIQNTIR